jgi:AraC-like DNA-binding protein
MVAERLIRDVCRLASASGCIVYASFRDRPGADVARLVRMGAHDVLTKDVDDSPRRIALSIRECLGLGALERLIDAAMAPLTPQQQTIIRWSIRRGIARSSVSDLAEDLGASTRTLRRRCDNLPGTSTRTLLAWGRMVHACRLLSHTTMSLEAIAESLDFSSVGDMHRKFHRLTQTRLSDVDRGDALEILVRALRAIALGASA